jgi:selenide,water dikinase
MSTLNKYAGEIIMEHNISACTDITGFGIMGHCYEMASGSKVSLKLFKKQIPYIKEAKEYANIGLVPEGSYNNRAYLEGKYELRSIPEWLEDILFDPQTSGGLLISCTKVEAEKLMNKLNKLELKSTIIGEVIPMQDKYIIVE